MGILIYFLTFDLTPFSPPLLQRRGGEYQEEGLRPS